MKILVVVDMQNDFLTGALRNEEGIKIIPLVKERIEYYKNIGGEVIATRDTHTEDYLNIQEGRNLPVVHCVKYTEWWAINSAIAPLLEGDKVFDKPCFGSMELALYLKDKYFDKQAEIEIEFVGVCTDICVISNVTLVKSALPEAKIIVNSSLCAGVSVNSHKTALDAMRACQVNVI